METKNAVIDSQAHENNTLHVDLEKMPLLPSYRLVPVKALSQVSRL